MKTTTLKKIVAPHLLIPTIILGTIFLFKMFHHTDLLLISVIPALVILALATSSLTDDKESKTN